MAVVPVLVTVEPPNAAKADADLLRTNDREGDIFDKPREVDFCFETAEREQAEDFVECE